MAKKTKYIFVVGGVMSGVGKGIAAASIGQILQSHGFEITSIKIDPYINVDAGTMNPTEHGEVFVLDDGMECDQDMGNYERFLNRDLTSANYMTTGSIYKHVIEKERNLEYGGKCVEVVPHIPLEIISRLNRAAAKNKADIVITEIGGTVGEYQNILFLEAVRILKLKHPGSVFLTLVSFLPSMGADGELKTKPTQYAVRSLNAAGLHPDMILARASSAIDRKRKEKISFNCSVPEANVISAPNVESIYEIPDNFRREGVDKIILKTLGLRSRKDKSKEWNALVKRIRTAKQKVKIGIVGKYFSTGSFVLADSYISVIEAVKHAAYALGAAPQIEWLNSEEFEGKNAAKYLKKLGGFGGIIIPGGFGERGVEGKIAAIKYCRIKKIPLFGLCYGMQLSAVEFARHVAGLKGANTTEVNPKTKYPVIDILPEQKKKMAEKDYGGTMRLGSYPAHLSPHTIARSAYRNELIHERHRHRFEMNPEYIHRLEKKGLIFSGASKDRRLMEILELPRNIHPFFLGTQFHPELKSRPLNPHPLFKAFIAASLKR
ncbi:MAG: CTP synthase [Candidatus Colwellbacteria bacterium RIFCSPLOWO2_01_FULL_48_10]|uniref:CTP synthase n=2 Tax=Bacteria candidate phyla TaxID=1783234 RepID=A0A1F5P416_9BACT|nr:MAG: CTP synthase [Candidatus Doudnabacteria bacterium RIFCSPHIGHO2_01_FULL_49_9]OGY59080.1 MAG: CTP synthase [Candidatus Colwellbacteria bacterium RIFCSPLOWO2_01_FULL_48_10]